MNDLIHHLPKHEDVITFEEVREVAEHLPGTEVLYSRKHTAPDGMVFVELALRIKEPVPPADAPADLSINVSDVMKLSDKVG